MSGYTASLDLLVFVFSNAHQTGPALHAATLHATHCLRVVRGDHPLNGKHRNVACNTSDTR